jgi:hypothetical protein
VSDGSQQQDVHVKVSAVFSGQTVRVEFSRQVVNLDLSMVNAEKTAEAIIQAVRALRSQQSPLS